MSDKIKVGDKVKIQGFEGEHLVLNVQGLCIQVDIRFSDGFHLWVLEKKCEVVK